MPIRGADAGPVLDIVKSHVQILASSHCVWWQKQSWRAPCAAAPWAEHNGRETPGESPAVIKCEAASKHSGGYVAE